jgi:Cytochrome domain of cellobiose dehydrogenase
MYFSFLPRPIWVVFLLISTFATAYRPTQFCKHRGQNGKADMCFGLNTFYNTTTQRSDIYITLYTFRFKSSAKGWACAGIGQRMMGALMFIVYGDPESPHGTMQTVVRTATGHHPPLSIDDESVYSGLKPEVEVRRSEFVKYEGQYFNEKLSLTPTHVGISEIVCYGCDVWEGFPIDNNTVSQKMIWSTNSWQDFQGDFGVNRAIEMHQFGLGFGFLWVDYLNAQVSSGKPFFPTIRETEGHYGMSEVGPPAAPTDEELADGARIIASGGVLPVDDAVDETPTTTETKPDDNNSPPPPSTEDGQTQPTPTPTPTPTDSLVYPEKTFKGKTLRDWMWHLHGLLMTLAFLLLYPLGAYFIRSGKATAFNLHWTTQAFASALVFVSAGIGYWQSYSISVAHQFLGIAICVALLAQIVLGWQHHRRYVVIKRKTWLSTTHVWMGRTVLGAGMVNLMLGVLLRKFGRTVIVCLAAAEILLIIVITFVVGKHSVRALSLPLDQRAQPMVGDEAEEYFQLVGDEDEDEDESDDEGNAAAEAKRDQAKRLARLDKV